LGSGFAFSPATNGVFVAAGDLNGDGLADIVAGSGGNQPGTVRAFSVATGVSVLAEFLAYESSYTNGVRVAVADVNNDGRTEIVTGSNGGRVASARAYSSSDNFTRNVYSNTAQFGDLHRGRAFVYSVRFRF
jgi:serralysin